MEPNKCAILLGLGVLALIAAGCGVGDKTYIFESGEDPAPAALDEDLQQALAAGGVTPVSRPQAESPELVALGQALFFDKELSGNRNISCATCHHPVAGTGDALPVSLGEGGVGVGANREKVDAHFIPRNAPHVFNGGVTGINAMFWDSRVQRDPQTGELAT